MEIPHFPTAGKCGPPGVGPQGQKWVQPGADGYFSSPVVVNNVVDTSLSMKKLGEIGQRR
jgi:hypothetical protein